MDNSSSATAPTNGNGKGNGPDPFALLGIAPSFDIELSELERAYHDQSRLLHPDRFAQADAAERVAALSRSRAINDAYQVLRRPASRAEYLLSRAGLAIGDSERLDPAFLMEILDLREELADARRAGATADIQRMEASMKTRRDALLATLSPAFADGKLQDVKRTLITLRYVSRYMEECDAALEEEDS